MLNPFALSDRKGRGFFKGRVAFSPAALFALSEPGVWYDPSDLSTLFQDTAGTQPITSPGQSVALALDKSKGLALGPEVITNGDFSAGATGWTLGTGWTISGGVATHTGTASGNLAQSPLVAGRAYRITMNVTNGTVNVYAGSSSFVLNLTGNINLILIASSSQVFIQSAIDGVTVDNVSYRELAGNHATQATAASRPIYEIEPSTGRRNLLTYTEQFDNAAWTKTDASISQNVISAPDGTTSADKITYNVGAGTGRVQQTLASVVAPYTFSFYAKAAELTKVSVRSDVGLAFRGCIFDLNAKTATVGEYFTSSSIQELGGGWFRCSCTATPSGVKSVQWQITNNGTGITGDGTSGIYIWGAQLETGSTATAYQKVVSQYDVTEAGVPSLPYLSFDGVDDFLVTPTITPGIDKVQVFAGVRKLSDAAAACIAEFSALYSSNNGSFFLQQGGLFNVDRLNFAIEARGSANAWTQVRQYTSPFTAVLAANLDLSRSTSADELSLRINGGNGAIVTNSVSEAGTGNFLAYPLYIGRRGGTSLPFNGRIYGLITRFGANLTADQIAATETWMNQRTGAY